MNPFMTVMKTFVMMMGEFQAESLSSDMANSPTYFCLFALFVFIIAMVLLNLLTGLAVSDTQAIKSNAEQLSRASCVKVIYEMESTLLPWYTFVEKWPKFLCPFINYLKLSVKNISLFPDTSYKKRIHVLPNKGPNIVFECDGLNEGEDGDELDNVQVTKAYEDRRHTDPQILNLRNNSNGQSTSCKMTPVIIGEATCIISKRSETDVNNMKENINQIQEALKENDSKLSKIENKIDVLFKNLSEEIYAIKRKLEHDKIQNKNKGSQK